MKSSEFINEGIFTPRKPHKDKYTTIVNNLVAIADETNKTGHLPFGTKSFKLQGKHMGNVPSQNKNSLLYDLGVNTQITSDTYKHPETSTMMKALGYFISSQTGGGYSDGKSFSENDAIKLAKVLYDWDQLMLKHGHDQHER